MRVILVADDPLARAGLADLLTEFDVVDQVATSESVLAAYRAHSPDAILWDFGWTLGAADWRDQLGEIADTGVPVVTLLPEGSLSAEVWSAGARGLLNREAGPAKISAALRAADQGLVTIDPALGGSLLPSTDQADTFQVDELTKRELEVLGLLAEGRANRSIAVQLKISEHTVKYHVNSILRKLGAQSRTEAVVRATRAGLILL